MNYVDKLSKSPKYGKATLNTLGAFHHQGFLRGFSAQRFFCPFLGQKNSCQYSCDETKKLAGGFQGFFCPKVFLPKGFSALFTLKEHFIIRVFQGFFLPKGFSALFWKPLGKWQ